MRYGLKLSLLCSALLVATVGSLAFAQAPPPPQQPANVAGTWNFYANDPNGSTSTKQIEIQQKGNVLTGHFKGPNQSGGIEGSIDQQHIVFHTKTRYVLTFRGRVTGNRVEGVVQGSAIDGTFHTRAGTGTFQARRVN